MTLTWLDKPFFDLIIQINGLLPYFLNITRYIAGILLTLNICLSAFKYAINHSGFKDDMVKMITASILFLVIISSYPSIINGLNKLVYTIAMNTLYTNEVQQVIDKTRDDSEFWSKKQDKKSGEYSDIIKTVNTETNSNTASGGQKYILDLYLEGTGYFSPNAVIRVLMLIFESILNRASMLPRFGPTAIPSDLGTWLLLIITALLVLFSGIFAAAQYFIGAVEFCLIAVIGVFMLPGMLWGGTKFLTEKFIGAVLGQFVKLLFVSICLMLMCTGYLSLATRSFTGAIDQVVYTCFAAIIYFRLCQSGPDIAISLLTGTPQMSLMDVVKGAATMAAGAAVGGKIAGGVAKTTMINGGATVAKAAGSATSSFKNNYQGENKSFGVATAAAAYGAGKSVLGSAGQAVQSGAHNLARSVLGGKTGGGGSSFNKLGGGTNRFSANDKYNTPNEDGTRQTLPEFYKKMFNEGKSSGIGKLGGDSADPKADGQAFSKTESSVPSLARQNVPATTQSGNNQTPWYGYPTALPPSSLPQSEQTSRYLPPSALPQSNQTSRYLPPPSENKE